MKKNKTSVSTEKPDSMIREFFPPTTVFRKNNRNGTWLL